MQKITFIFFVFYQSLSYAQQQPWLTQVGAHPFELSNREVSANDYGAVGDSMTLNTQAIQRAIDECAKHGGGTVVFKPGRYLTGSIFLKSEVRLKIDEGVFLLGSTNLKDYPIIDTRVAGIEMKWPAALINIIGQHHATVSGEGIIDGRGKPFWDAYWALRKEYDPKKLRWIVDYDAQRPRLLLVDNCQDVTIENVTLRRSGFWTVHVLYSSYVTVDGIVVQNNIGGHGPSTDGVDIDSSSWILVQNADIDCNDDNFCIKSGRDWDGLRVNKPTEYVLIQNCISRKGGGLITFGSETSGGMRHIVARNLKAHGTKVGMRFKSARNRGGTVQDIYLSDIQMDSVGVAFEVTPNWNPAYSYSELPKGYDKNKVPDHWRKMLEPVPAAQGIPTFKEIYITNIKVGSADKAVFVDGLKENPLRNFHLKNVSIQAKTAGSIAYAKDWELEKVSISTKDQTKLKLMDTANIVL